MNKVASKSIFKYVLWALPPCLLCLFTFAIYFSTLWYGFIFDDLPTIIEYIHIRSFDVKGLFFRSTRWLSRLINQYTYSKWGENPFGYRIFDVLLHIAIGALIFVFLFKLLSQLKKNDFLREHAYLFATVVTGLFLLHPVQTQTVTYVTQMRLEGLVVFFAFAVLLSFTYAVYARSMRGKIMWYSMAFLALSFGTGSKEIFITLPALIFLVDWFFLAEGNWVVLRGRLWVHACFFILTFGLLWRYGSIIPHHVIQMATTPLRNNRGNLLTESPQVFITTWAYFISQFKVIIHYIRIFFWPVNLSFDYEHTFSNGFFSFDVILPLFTILGIWAYAAYAFIKNKVNITSFCVAWFFVTMLPRASIFPGTELVCDYKTYIASFGALFFIGFWLISGFLLVAKKIAEKKLFQMTIFHHIFAWSFLFLLLGVGTKTRNFVWSSEENLWRDVIKNAPLKSRAYNNLAAALGDQGREEEAIKSLEKAIECDGSYGEPHINLASIYHRKGERAKAYDHYMKAVETREGHPSLYNNLGMFYFEDKAYDKAEESFKLAIDLKPYFSLAWKNLGNMYVQCNKVDAAAYCYDQALSGDRVDEEMLYMHGALNHALGKLDKAVASLKKVNPDYRDTAYLLGAIFFSMQKYRDACPYMEAMYKKMPGNNSAAYNYALCLLNIGKPQEAMPLFDKCRKNLQEQPYAALHFGRCLFETGKKEAAKHELQALLKQIKNNYVKHDTIAYMKEVKLV